MELSPHITFLERKRDEIRTELIPDDKKIKINTPEPR